MSTWAIVLTGVGVTLAAYILILAIAVRKALDYIEDQERKEREEEEESHD